MSTNRVQILYIDSPFAKVLRGKISLSDAYILVDMLKQRQIATKISVNTIPDCSYV